LFHDEEELPDFIDDEEEETVVVRICCQAMAEPLQQVQQVQQQEDDNMDVDNNHTSTSTSRSHGVHGLVLFRVLAHGDTFSPSFVAVLDNIPPNSGVPLVLLSFAQYSSAPVTYIQHATTDATTGATSLKGLKGLKGLLPSHVCGQGRFSSIVEIRLSGLTNQAPPRAIVSYLSQQVRLSCCLDFLGCRVSDSSLTRL